jgi:Flp pilus assembly protein TadD
MDKYEFNYKIDQMKKLMNEGDAETALKVAEAIDWNRVRNINLLSLASQVYEENGLIDDAKDKLLLAFERAPVGKRLLYKLTELSVRSGDLEEAEEYFREFADIAADDNRVGLLEYMLLKAKHAPYARLIEALTRYTDS